MHETVHSSSKLRPLSACPQPTRKRSACQECTRRKRSTHLDRLQLILAGAERLLAALHRVLPLPAAAIAHRALVRKVRQAPAQRATGMSQPLWAAGAERATEDRSNRHPQLHGDDIDQQEGYRRIVHADAIAQHHDEVHRSNAAAIVIAAVAFS